MGTKASIASAPTIEYPEIPDVRFIQGNSILASGISEPRFYALFGFLSGFSEQDDILYLLADCESKNNPLAYNPKDLDNTPSYGRFQFKLSTFKFYVKKYDLFNWQNWDEADWQNALWDGQVQEEVVRKMFVDPQVNLLKEFPTCGRKLGLKKNYTEN